MIFVVMQCGYKVDSAWPDKAAAEARAEALARISWRVELHEIPVGVSNASAKITRYPTGGL
jgi:hypothetical protein